MQKMNVKICGITSPEDANMVALAGADVIGVVIDVPVPTPRKVTLEKAIEIKDSLSGINQAFVAVIMPHNVDEAVEVAEKLRPDGLQLHGTESVGFIRELAEAVDCYIIKALHIKDTPDMDYVMEVASSSDMLLLDTKSQDKVGGTGQTHDYDIDIMIRDATKRRIILAGGLNPDNVAYAVNKVRPYAVDVSSGVESVPGKKDPELVKKFIEVTSCL